MKGFLSFLLAAVLLLGAIGSAEAWGQRGRSYRPNNNYNRGCGNYPPYYSGNYNRYPPTYANPIGSYPYYPNAYPAYYPGYYDERIYVNAPGVVRVGVGPWY